MPSFLEEQPGLLYVVATLLPLASFVVLFLGGRRWGKVGAYIATGAIGGAFVLSLAGFVLYLSHHGEEHAAVHEHSHAGDHGDHDADEHEAHPPWAGSTYWAFLQSKKADEPAAGLKLGYYIDGLAAVMFLMITLIASLIHIYSIGYMGDELQQTVEDHQAHVRRRGRFSRFFMFLSLFCFSMLNLVLADNLFQVFISWELVGICSYLLIGYYYERRSASDAANKAFITNRVGDAGFLIGMLIIWTQFGTFSFYSERDEGHIEAAGIFDSIRSPKMDAHDEKAMPQAGQIVRAERVTVTVEGKPQQRLQPDPSGSEVVLFGKGHFDAPEEGLYVPAEAEDAMDHHSHPNQTMPYWLLTLAGIGIFMGCVGKSAQFPLQVWLPDAMEGPTPVSALIHAATMVAAGVYLVGRAYPLFTPEVLLIIAYVGAVTLFVAATIAIVQTDIKKVLAYSTVSQLGFMMLALAVGGWAAGLFHLLTHAFFKALLFLGSGSVIYGTHHEQEMTKMGGLYPKMKITALTMLVGVLAIAGTPLFSGWYSKDAILVNALSFATLRPTHILLFLLPLLTAGITAFYMFRLWFMTFTGKPRDEQVYEHAHESPRTMTWPLIVLAIGSIFVGWGINPIDVHGSWLEHDFLHHEYPDVLPEPADTFTVMEKEKGNDALLPALVAFQVDKVAYLAGWNLPSLHTLAGILALAAAAAGAGLAFVMYYLGGLDPAETKAQFPKVHRFLWNKWYFDHLYSVALVRPALVVARACRWFDTRAIDGAVDNSARATVLVSKWDGKFDLGVIDGLVNLTADVIHGVGAWLRVFQTGLIRNYVLFLALAAVGIFAVVSYVMG